MLPVQKVASPAGSWLMWLVHVWAARVSASASARPGAAGFLVTAFGPGARAWVSRVVWEALCELSPFGITRVKRGRNVWSLMAKWGFGVRGREKRPRASSALWGSVCWGALTAAQGFPGATPALRVVPVSLHPNYSDKCTCCTFFVSFYHHGPKHWLVSAEICVCLQICNLQEGACK